MGYLTGAMTSLDGDQDTGDRQVEVFATDSAPEAEVVRGLLESNGIPAAIRGMTQGPYRMGGSYVWVPLELEAQARALIAEAQQDAARSDDDPIDLDRATTEQISE
jgi:hypothetical protein